LEKNLINNYYKIGKKLYQMMKEIEKRKVLDFAAIFSAEYRVPDSLQTRIRPSYEEETLNSSLKMTFDQS
jgi:hypothetical protein